VLPTLVAPKPPGLRRRSAKTNDKYPNPDENHVALGFRPAAFTRVCTREPRSNQRSSLAEARKKPQFERLSGLVIPFYQPDHDV
jgi:hypothetical protein